MKNKNLITTTIDLVGLVNLARACDVSHQAVRKWEKADRLPRTEWTGESNYSKVFEAITKGEVKRSQLLKRPTKKAA